MFTTFQNHTMNFSDSLVIFILTFVTIWALSTAVNILGWMVFLSFRFVLSCILSSETTAGTFVTDTFVREDLKKTLGDRMKEFEKEEYILPENAYLVRLDGKNFSSFTSKFKKPFDERFTKAMVLTMNKLLDEFIAVTGFCCSDEITLVFPPIHGKASEHAFNGRKNKIATLLSGKCSTLFLLNLLAILEQEKTPDLTLIQYVKNKCPCFDSRVIEIQPHQFFEVCNNIYWRSQYDCKRNSIATYARHILGPKSCIKKGGNEMIELMKQKGFDFTTLETYKIYGTFAKKKKVPFTNAYGPFERNETFNFECIMECNPEMTNFLLSPESLSQDELLKVCTNLKLKEITI
jgi:tRNA(His) guanylyltransferase